MDYIGSDIQRALIGGTAGAALGVTGAVVTASALPLWATVPLGLLGFAATTVCGGGVALVIGDWWDRR